MMFAKPADQIVERPTLFLEVKQADRIPDFWPWAGRYAIHLPGDGSLVVQRRDRREHAAVYSAGGWHRYRFVMRRASEVQHYLADKHLPVKPTDSPG